MNENASNSVRVRYFWLVVWLATLLLLIGALFLLPYLPSNAPLFPTEARPPQPSIPTPDNLLDEVTIYHLRAMDGKLCLTAKKVTILFEGIPMDENTNGIICGRSFPIPGTTISGSGSCYFGSREVKIIENSGEDNTFDMQVNEYKMRLVDLGKALEIDGQVFPFEEPRTVTVSKDGKATTQNARPELRQSSSSSSPAAQKRHKFSQVSKITKIVVLEHSREVRTIEKADQIDKIVQLVNKHLEGWEVPWYGIPVPVWTVVMYSGEKLMGSFGSGKGFFETQREGGFFSKAATESDLKDFHRLIGTE